MNWNKLETAEQLAHINQESFTQPILILKHSTTCSISVAALGRLERSWTQEAVGNLKPYYLDLLRYRPISAQIAAEFAVTHESPQVLIIHNGKSIYDASHFNIRFDEIKKMVNE
ncbi:MAG: bacillithiol system redox-active protein YtxJ [Runella slithyformis]|jgi:bacillithiol system protein YtxJ|nr:MAG: bacillithiol system redox-active protein YtxJ [Runella slithyformis]TAG20415.1 MAG: bacillithiol system redox-active protein YtxJ [Cytophagales bacterium]TAG39611.1 MAG: bacillithiol system redox-active protein YtxJ [Cytophagia bacterium]TAF23276.1 MAG: bacillithiol system redox-active protein YtxJ [Runella slithyformis]TAF45704.1 MAG: bacillithiol system redox-active protein YtxJ [Runella slithyformis]